MFRLLTWISQRTPRALTWIARPTILVALVALIAGFQIVRAVTAERPAMPAVYGDVPPFELTDQTARRYGSADLDGRVWIASFLYTRCSTCLIAQRLSKLQDSVKNASPYLHIVTFTVDPAHDTPAALRTYAYQFRPSPRMWTWLTGPPDDVLSAVRSLGVSVGSPATIGESTLIPVDASYVLVDANMQIRGRYDASSPAQVDEMMRDAGLLLNYRD